MEMHENDLVSFRLCLSGSYANGLPPFTQDDLSEMLFIQGMLVWNS